MGTHLRVLSENYPMSTNMTGFKFGPLILILLNIVPNFREVTVCIASK